MIDIAGVLANLLWILGLATLLAAWSFSYYEAQRTQQRVRDVFQRPGYAWALTVGLTLFCAGMAATEDRLWAQILWGLLMLAFPGEAFWRQRATHAADNAPHA